MRITPWLWQIAYTGCRASMLLRTRVGLKRDSESPMGPVLLCAKHGSSLDIPLMSWVCRALRGDRPYFQMGAFVGYPVLGRISFILRRVGGFPVMRPKETRRLMEKQGLSRREALEEMKRYNDRAEAIRRDVLRRGRCLTVFPEGTRDCSQVLPLRSKLEVETAHAMADDPDLVAPILIWPVMIAFGPYRFFRRDVVVHLLKPFPLQATPAETISTLEDVLRQHFIPPSQVPGLVDKLRL